MNWARFILIALALVLALSQFTLAQAQRNREPSIGYAYPAGTERGKSVDVLVGGQALRGTRGAYISGEGVRVKFIKHYAAVRNLDGDQREELQHRMRESLSREWTKLRSQGFVGPPPFDLRSPTSRPATTQPTDAAKLPDHWLWDNLDQKSLPELLHIRHLLAGNSRRQPNEQIAETVLVRVEIDANAAPGDRELRLIGRAGVTNPVVFQIGTLPETTELENNDPEARSPLPDPKPLPLPIVINGQILPGDVDRHRFSAMKGQRLVIRASARRLAPFMADAVPGWFEAAISVRDESGREVAFADHHRFDPDPVLLLRVPADGTYTLEVRDTIYRGREDFVYRISIGETPFITGVAPLGTHAGADSSAVLQGWNLWTTRIPFRTREPGLATTSLVRGRDASNGVAYEISTLPSVREQTNNNTIATAQSIPLGVVIDGVIEAPGDRDTFRFPGKAGQEVVVEVHARRLGSPVDSLVRLFDSTGKLVAWSDDTLVRRKHLHADWGLQTHPADSYLRATLAGSGDYFVQITDAQRQSGPECAYRMRVSAPRPDFAVKLAPSALSLEPGKWSYATAHVIRYDGYAGEILLSIKSGPAGVVLSGARIPPNAETVKIAIATDRQIDGVQSLELEATGAAGGSKIRHEVAPTDEVEQAFLWHHLIPREQTLVASTGPVERRGRTTPVPRLKSDATVRLVAGGSASVVILDEKLSRTNDLSLRIVDAPPGVTVGAPRVKGEQISFEVRVALGTDPVAGNLLLEAFSSPPTTQPADPNKQPAGTRLPAIAFEVTR